MSTLILPYPSTHPDLRHGKYVAGLFAKGEQGAWYDPSDLSTLFQDAYGTTPVTAVGQPVGLILDRRYGAMRGDELFTSPASYLGTLNSGWTFENGAFRAITPQTYSYPTTGSNGSGVTYATPLTVGKTYEIIFTVNATSGKCGANVGSYNVASPGFRSSGTHRVIQKYENLFGIQVQAGSDFVGTIAINSVREIPGNHATQATTTSRPTLQQDTSGKYYLSFDGVDDYLSTGSIDFTATDKMTVLAGLRKLRDSPIGTVVEASTNSQTNDGAFFMTAPPGGGNTFLFGSRGTQLFYAYTPVGGVWAAPISVVQSGISEIPSKVNMRLNGALAAQQLVSQGTGKYGNYPLYIGRRGGTTNPFAGNLYGLIVRGAQTDDLHLTHAEKYPAYKSGVSL